METVGIVALDIIAAIVLGLPLAIAVRPGSIGRLAIDAFLLGFVVLLLAPTAVAWLGWPGLVLVAAAWIAAIVVVVVRRPGLPSLARPRRVDVLFWILGAIVLAATAFPRLENVNFLPWVGDMGAYVNWANEFARTGEFNATWPPVVSAYLGMHSAIFGPGLATAAMPASGIVLVVAIARLMRELGADRWICLAAAAVAGAHVHLIWYATLPSSESLNAPLVLVWGLALVAALRSRSVIWAAYSGLVMLVLSLLRGTGPFLLVPVFVVAIASLLLPAWKTLSARLFGLVTANLAGAFVAYWYGISEINTYYVGIQMGAMLPARLLAFVDERLGLFTPSPSTALVLVAGVAAFALVTFWIARARERARVRDDGDRPAPAWPTVAFLAVVAAALAASLVATQLEPAGTQEILKRVGQPFFLLAVAGVVACGLPRVPARVSVFGAVAGLIASLFILIHTDRLTGKSDHAFFLYWDRYLVSEALPLVLVLAGMAVNLAFVASRRWLPVGSAWRVVVMSAVGVLVFALAVVPHAREIKRMLTGTEMDGAYALDVDLAELVADPDTPVLWTSTSAAPYPGLSFPNTWMAFGRPLATSFGLDVLRVGDRNNFAPDDVADADLLEAAIACSPSDRIVVLEVQSDGPSLDERVTGFELRELGTVQGEVDLLRQTASPEWREVEFTVDAWEVAASADSDAVACNGAVDRWSAAVD